MNLPPKFPGQPQRAFSPALGSGRSQPHSLSFSSVKQRSLEVQVGRDGERGTEGESNSVPVISHFGHFLTVQPKDLLILLVYIKLSVYLSFRNSLAEQSQPPCLSPGDTSLPPPTQRRMKNQFTLWVADFSPTSHCSVFKH